MRQSDFDSYFEEEPTVCLRIEELCREKSTTLAQLSKKLNMKLFNLERLIYGNPTVKSLKRVANALEVDIVELFED